MRMKYSYREPTSVTTSKYETIQKASKHSQQNQTVQTQEKKSKKSMDNWERNNK